MRRKSTLVAGGVYGEGYGEVFGKHLTIGKADKQRDLEQIGEMLYYFSTKSFSVDFIPRRGIDSMNIRDYQ